MYYQTPEPGKSYPLGSTVYPDGVNFSLYSRNASSVELLFFNSPIDPTPSHVFKLNQKDNRTFHYWHIFIPGAVPQQLYGYRVDGQFKPEEGLR